MTRVVIESPYSESSEFGTEDHIEFALDCCRQAYELGYNPFASHLFYTRFMDDSKTIEREDGIRMGLQWTAYADEAWFCFPGVVDFSDGMAHAYQHHVNKGRTCRYFILREGVLIEIVTPVKAIERATNRIAKKLGLEEPYDTSS